MRENRLWRKICAHVLSVFMILSMVGTALPGIGVLPAEEAYAAAAGISTATKGQMVNLGPTMAPDGGNANRQQREPVSREVVFRRALTL